MSWDRSEPPTLAEEAAHWLLELEEPDSGTLSRFAAWLEISPRHVEEFLLASAVWKEFDHFDTACRLDIERLVAEARNNVRTIGLPTSEAAAAAPRRAPARRIRSIALAAAAIGAIAVGVALWQAPRVQPQSYATVRGEQRALKLEDGSVVYLNTQSRVEVQFSKNVRLIRLLEGEAMFNVEHDAARPFRVMAGPTVIQAIGTRFNVYRSAAGATVSVVEGVVQISPKPGSVPGGEPQSPAATLPASAVSAEPHRARVSAGEQARISADGGIITRSVPDLAQIVSWRERRLVFRADRLEEVATQFNRYNALQLRIEDDALRGKQITGVFDADDPRSFVQFLQRDNTLAVEDGGGEEILIRRRADY
jgi:transmembrane sensor